MPPPFVCDSVRYDDDDVYYVRMMKNKRENVCCLLATILLLCKKKKKKQYTRQASRYTIVEWIIYFYRNKACVCTLYFMGERQKCGKKIIQRGKFFLCVFLHVGCRRRCRPYIRFKWHYLLVDYRDAQTGVAFRMIVLISCDT